MNKSEYLTGVGNAFDQGVIDAQQGITKQDYGGAYAVGYDGYNSYAVDKDFYLRDNFRSIAVKAASKGWDDGAKGISGTPEIPAISAEDVVADLKQTYDFAYDLGKSAPIASSGSSLKWIVGGTIGVVAAAVLFLGWKESKEELALAQANPSSGVPKAEIEWMVGNLSVGTPDEEVREYVESKARKVGYSDKRTKACGDYAIKVHAKNRRLYHDIYSGRIGR